MLIGFDILCFEGHSGIHVRFIFFIVGKNINPKARCGSLTVRATISYYPEGDSFYPFLSQEMFIKLHGEDNPVKKVSPWYSKARKKE
jgi:ABC-type multidrug transport system ATPase subunit